MFRGVGRRLTVFKNLDFHGFWGVRGALFCNRASGALFAALGLLLSLAGARFLRVPPSEPRLPILQKGGGLRQPRLCDGQELSRMF